MGELLDVLLLSESESSHADCKHAKQAMMQPARSVPSSAFSRPVVLLFTTSSSLLIDKSSGSLRVVGPMSLFGLVDKDKPAQDILPVYQLMIKNVRLLSKSTSNQNTIEPNTGRAAFNLIEGHCSVSESAIRSAF